MTSLRWHVGSGGLVEGDETFVGNDGTVKPKGEKTGRGYAHRHRATSQARRNVSSRGGTS
ncbi:hypothetical protein [Methylobacterium sp. SD274]|uniref:hypothetical protein n=1 Tax=Methylobacterium sp. SD274 TaxID=2782009 RepID=UPI001A970298|nr:hypothetical protein [Methylobacterium sp. SD274]